jgi:hypothetical protein
MWRQEQCGIYKNGGLGDAGSINIREESIREV